jgi:predicted PurR-regulated permease PerM
LAGIIRQPEQKRISEDVHPVITGLGILIGLRLFGFIGLIFGPLPVSYIILLFKIYMSEFVELKTGVAEPVGKESSK